MASKNNRTMLMLALVATALSAAGWWFGAQLHPVWWLTWLAPLPILWLATRVRAPWAALAAFVAFAIGDLPYWTYMHSYIRLPLAPTLVAIFGPALVMMLAVLLYRRLAMQHRHLAAAFAVPVVVVAIWFLNGITSANATWGNPGYTQMDALAVIQVAALTGVAGVCFLVMLGPACAAVLCNGSASRVARLRTLLAAGGLIALALIFGVWRLHAAPADSGAPASIGLVSLDNAHPLQSPTSAAGAKLMQRYVDAVQRMAAEGAQYVLIPEDSWAVSQRDVPALQDAATRTGVTVLTGVDYKPRTGAERNMLLAFHPQRSEPAVYMKHHLVPGLESRYAPGNGYTMLGGTPRIGMAICKDMDFPGMGRAYAERNTQLLLVPAWDFKIDGWLHSRMAIMRGVEGGLAVARSARNGRLTLSDDRGRVIAESSSFGQDARLVGTLRLRHTHTLYARWGNWFGWLDVAALVALLALAGSRQARRLLGLASRKPGVSRTRV
ncbi:MAG TPA: nitrilase-related carbon-nitrogen hydrolase [Rhodanobacteraceae bacterium]|nr:nitrilase-related carbon-nitrogen hydrolase [Rhodanobacteraceae bacterium]